MPEITGGAMDAYEATYTFEEVAPVPEPAALALLGTGLVGVAVRIRRKRPQSAAD